MKIFILLFLCIVFLDLTSAMNGSPPREKQLPTLPAAFQRIRIFIHKPDDKVFSGIVQGFPGTEYPRWVLDPNPEYYTEHRVYLRLPSGRGVVSNIQSLKHEININDDIPEEPRCFLSTEGPDFISTEGPAFLSGVLHPYNYVRLPEPSTRPRCFVRMPGNNAVYVGELHFNYGRRPSWFE